MRPPPRRIGNGGRNSRTKPRIRASSTSSEIAAIAKSLRSNSRYSAAMCGNSSRHGSHQEAQKFTSVTRPAKRASGTVSPPPPPRPGGARGGGGGWREGRGAGRCSRGRGRSRVEQREGGGGVHRDPRLAGRGGGDETSHL